MTKLSFPVARTQRTQRTWILLRSEAEMKADLAEVKRFTDGGPCSEAGPGGNSGDKIG